MNSTATEWPRESTHSFISEKDHQEVTSRGAHFTRLTCPSCGAKLGLSPWLPANGIEPSLRLFVCPLERKDWYIVLKGVPREKYDAFVKAWARLNPRR